MQHWISGTHNSIIQYIRYQRMEKGSCKKYKARERCWCRGKLVKQWLVTWGRGRVKCVHMYIQVSEDLAVEVPWCYCNNEQSVTQSSLSDKNTLQRGAEKVHNYLQPCVVAPYLYSIKIRLCLCDNEKARLEVLDSWEVVEILAGGVVSWWWQICSSVELCKGVRFYREPWCHCNNEKSLYKAI